jgi:hypothetical protein
MQKSVWVPKSEKKVGKLSPQFFPYEWVGMDVKNLQFCADFKYVHFYNLSVFWILQYLITVSLHWTPKLLSA